MDLKDVDMGGTCPWLRLCQKGVWNGNDVARMCHCFTCEVEKHRVGNYRDNKLVVEAGGL